MNTINTNKPLLEINNLTVMTKQSKLLQHDHSTISNKNFNKDLKEDINQKIILENFNLTINPGEIHVIMGPNGAGKSTLAKILVNHPDYTITKGNINYLGKNLADFSPNECATHGIFLSFQNPIAIPGVSNLQFLKTAVNAIRKAKHLNPLDAIDFLELIKQKMKILHIPEEFLYRSINEDFSGGEKKRNEILQMLLLEPTFIILDEIDSGLDIDALKLIATTIKSTLNPSNAILIITHYQRILNYLIPDAVHILNNKKIIRSGDHTLVKKLETQGYTWLNTNSLE